MYLKQENTGVVINNDEEKLNAIIASRVRYKEMRRMQKEISMVRKELDQLKILVLELLDKNKG